MKKVQFQSNTLEKGKVITIQKRSGILITKKNLDIELQTIIEHQKKKGYATPYFCFRSTLSAMDGKRTPDIWSFQTTEYYTKHEMLKYEFILKIAEKKGVLNVFNFTQAFEIIKKLALSNEIAESVAVAYRLPGSDEVFLLTAHHFDDEGGETYLEISDRGHIESIADSLYF